MQLTRLVAAQGLFWPGAGACLRERLRDYHFVLLLRYAKTRIPAASLNQHHDLIWRRVLNFERVDSDLLAAEVVCARRTKDRMWRRAMAHRALDRIRSIFRLALGHFKVSLRESQRVSSESCVTTLLRFCSPSESSDHCMQHDAKRQHATHKIYLREFLPPEGAVSKTFMHQGLKHGYPNLSGVLCDNMRQQKGMHHGGHSQVKHTQEVKRAGCTDCGSHGHTEACRSPRSGTSPAKSAPSKVQAFQSLPAFDGLCVLRDCRQGALMVECSARRATQSLSRFAKSACSARICACGYTQNRKTRKTRMSLPSSELRFS